MHSAPWVFDGAGWELAVPVAQTSSLLCRRLPAGRAPEQRAVPNESMLSDFAERQRIGNPRYSRLETCATGRRLATALATFNRPFRLAGVACGVHAGDAQNISDGVTQSMTRMFELIFDPKGTLFRRAMLVCAALWLVPSTLAAAIRQVPEQYPNIKAAYNAAQSGDTISIQPNLYLEIPPALFNNPSKVVLFQMASGRAVITASNPPPNDTFAGRTILSGVNFSNTSDNYTATFAPEPGDPVPGGAAASAFGRSLWFEWTAPASGLAIVNTVGSDFPALVGVYTGNPPRIGGISIIWGGQAHDTPNEVGFNVQSNATYEILVGGYNRAYGQIVLNVAMVTPPPNDYFSAAYRLTGNAVEVQGTTYSATFESLEPNHAGAAASNSVWFTWTASAGDAVASRPVTFSALGSDFKPVLAVYEGSALGQLANRVAGESKVTFTPTPGATYFVALDGSTSTSRARGRVGNYLLRLDYSIVNLDLSLFERELLGDGRTSFQGAVNVRDWGLAPTGPLRLRLAARPGKDLSGIHRASASSETNLFAVTVPNGLMPGEQRVISVSGVCPGVTRDADGHYNSWGVFAVLEEYFAGKWIQIDQAFYLYGAGTVEQVFSYGIGRPALSPLAANEANQVLGVEVQPGNYITDGSSNVFDLVALLDDYREGAITNATWSAPAWVTITNGLLRIGDIPGTTNFTVIARYNLGGVARTITDVLPVYKRPRLTLLPTATRNNFQFQYVIQGDFSAPFILEYKDDLRAAWMTHSVGMLSLIPSTNALVGTNFNQRFYRLSLHPPR